LILLAFVGMPRVEARGGMATGDHGIARRAKTDLFGGVRKEANMLWAIFVILLILWGLGLMTGYTLGGVIHVLLVIAIVVVVVQVIKGRRRV
jgi:hypothetical protein